MRTHEEFCAEIDRRKQGFIKKKKNRQRIALACIPFVLCLGIFAATGIRGEDPHAAESGALSSISELAKHVQTLQITLPAESKYSGKSFSVSESTVAVKQDADAVKLLSFIEENESKFLFSEGDEGWYILADTELLQSRLPLQSSPYEACLTDPAEATIEQAETVCESEGSILPLPEGTEAEEMTERVEDAEAVQSDLPQASVDLTDAMTAIDVEYALNGETSLPYIPTNTPGKYAYCSPTLGSSVTSINDVYLISIRLKDGTQVQYALDTVKHKALAKELQSLIDSFAD